MVLFHITNADAQCGWIINPPERTESRNDIIAWGGMQYFCIGKNRKRMEKTRNAIIDCRELLAQFSDKREALVLVYLHAVANDEGKVHSSVYAMAHQLNMHRQTLTRFIRRLCEKGYAVWDSSSHGTQGVTLLPLQSHLAKPSEPVGYDNTSILPVTASVTDDVTPKEEKKEKKNENPPTPPKEEKNQKKEENNLSDDQARKKKTARKNPPPSISLEQRRQQFLDTLTPFVSRYSKEMIQHFSEYWTEANRSQTRMRFEMQPTWNTTLRLARWARNEQIYNQNNHNYERKRQPTSADYIKDAQLHAINATEDFIRQAEVRRGGVPPHLPF